MKFLFRTYFFLKTSIHNLSELETTSYVIFATKALFISAIFLRPNAPTPFGMQIESQLLRQQTCLFSSILPLLNFLLLASNFEHT